VGLWIYLMGEKKEKTVALVGRFKGKPSEGGP
jgi:hypothetical protein